MVLGCVGINMWGCVTASDSLSKLGFATFHSVHRYQAFIFFTIAISFSCGIIRCCAEAGEKVLHDSKPFYSSCVWDIALGYIAVATDLNIFVTKASLIRLVHHFRMPIPNGEFD